MLVLALFSKFEIFKTFLNKKIRTLTQFFYFNRSAINFCAHTRKTCEQKIWTIQMVFSGFHFTKKAQMPTELLIAEFWWNKSRTNLICDMCHTLGCYRFYCVAHAHPHFNNCFARTCAPHLNFCWSHPHPHSHFFAFFYFNLYFNEKCF